MPLKVFFEVIDVKEKNGYKQFSIPWYIDRQSSVKKPTRKIFQVIIPSIFYPFTYVTHDNPG